MAGIFCAQQPTTRLIGAEGCLYADSKKKGACWREQKCGCTGDNGGQRSNGVYYALHAVRIVPSDSQSHKQDNSGTFQKHDSTELKIKENLMGTEFVKMLRCVELPVLGSA